MHSVEPCLIKVPTTTYLDTPCKCGSPWVYMSHSPYTDEFKVVCEDCGLTSPPSSIAEGAEANWKALQLILSN